MRTWRIEDIRRRRDYLTARVRRSTGGRRTRQILADLSYRTHRDDRASGEGARVVAELRRNGIATTTVRALGIDEKSWIRLSEEASLLPDSPEAIKIGVDPRENPDQHKPFFLRLLGHKTLHTSEPDAYNAVALDPALLAVVNDYLGTYSWLMRYNVWLNKPSGQPPRTSQLWHRDGPGRYIKAFFAIEQIGPDNGPFSYVPGTHERGPRGRLRPEVILEGDAERVMDEEMARHVPSKEWISAMGPPGTIILADTFGFHKGGFVTEGRRLLFKNLFGDWMCRHGSMVKFDSREGIARTRAQRWAAGW